MTHTPSIARLTTGPVPASTLSTIGLFAFVVLAWSLNWVVMKLAVQEITPLWAVTIRTSLAALALFSVLLAAGQLAEPPRADLPVIVVIAPFHMTAFAALMTAGLTLVPASRAIVLGYTTPVWVAPAARLFLASVSPDGRRSVLGRFGWATALTQPAELGLGAVTALASLAAALFHFPIEGRSVSLPARV